MGGAGGRGGRRGYGRVGGRAMGRGGRGCREVGVYGQGVWTNFQFLDSISRSTVVASKGGGCGHMMTQYF